MTRALRIAVAEDEPDILRYYQALLARLGHKVVVATRTGRELVEQCRAARPDLILTDIRMPDLDGIEAAAQICQEIPVPVIVVSAYRDAELLRRAQAGHILAYLVKPIDENNLEPAIAVALGRFQELEALRSEVADLRSRVPGTVARTD